MCLYPKIIDNPKYRANKKNGGVIPVVFDERTKYVPIGCGKCMECKKQKGNGWRVRLQEEIRENKKGLFVTLTFSEESLKILKGKIKGLKGYNLENEIATKAVRWFLERWRKKYKKSVKHWLVTELGHNGTERIHLHGIIWTENRNEIKKIWKYGHVWIGKYVNDKTITYITKYVNKIDIVHKEYNSKILTSAGIGKGYIKRKDAKNNKYKGTETEEGYKTRQGTKIALPKYYRNAIYNDEEKEKLWIEKLNKEERWVNGTRVDISKGDEEYYKLLEKERLKNKRLGYGDNEINWERRNYENERRNINKMKEIKKKHGGIDSAPKGLG